MGFVRVGEKKRGEKTEIHRSQIPREGKKRGGRRGDDESNGGEGRKEEMSYIRVRGVTSQHPKVAEDLLPVGTRRDREEPLM